MKPTKTPQEKFKAGLKKSGYDPDAGAKRLLDLIAKQKKEREEFESKYKSAYEGREMKTLKQIIEGTVVMSDFKLDKRGRKYKAHRKSMGSADMTNEGRAEDAFAELDAEVEKSRSGKKSMDQANSLDIDVDKFRERVKSGQAGKSTKLSDMNPLDREQWEKSKKAAGIEEDVEQVDEISQELHDKYMSKAITDFGHANLARRVGKGKDKEEAAAREKKRAAGIATSVRLTTRKNMKEDTILEGATKIDQQSGSDRAFDVTHKGTNKKIGTVYTPGKTNPNHVATVNGMDGNPVKKAEFSSFKEAHKFITDNHPLTRDIDENVDIGEGMQQTLRKYVPGYAKSQINKKMDAEKFGRRDVDKDENYKRYKKVMDKVTKEEFTGFSNFSEGFINPYNEILEARGRPPSAATLAKRAAAKPREDEEEGEHYDADSGVEADQHIHVQLKKAADSDQKPFQVSFKNGKKHAVSQKVAKDILGATERLKPEHRKNVHDEIHQSYDNLMSVHRLVAGR
jgi:hypothetical protein